MCAGTAIKGLKGCDRTCLRTDLQNHRILLPKTYYTGEAFVMLVRAEPNALTDPRDDAVKTLDFRV